MALDFRVSSGPNSFQVAQPTMIKQNKTYLINKKWWQSVPTVVYNFCWKTIICWQPIIIYKTRIHVSAQGFKYRKNTTSPKDFKEALAMEIKQ